MTSKKENDVAREARSVACANAPGRFDVSFSMQGGKTVSAALDLAGRLANVGDGESLLLSINGRTLRVSNITTQAKATYTQEDADALVKAATELCAAHPLDDAVTDLELALTPFQKG